MTTQEVYQPRKNVPRFFYGYIVVVLCFLIMMVSFGLMDSFGVFVKPLLNEFGWTRATISAAYSLSFLIFGFAGIIMGGLTDRFGPRLVLTFCGIFLGLGYLLWLMQAREMWMFYPFAIVIGLANGGEAASDTPLVARLFGLNSVGAILGVISCAFCIGAALGPIITGHIFDSTTSYQLAFVVCSAFAIVGLIISSLLRPTKRLQLKI